MPLAEQQQRLIDNLGIIPDRLERLAVIVDRTRRLKPFSIAEKTPAHRVAGCQSTVWLIGELHPDGTVQFRCDAESPLVKGLVHLLCQFYSGTTPAEIVETEPAFLDELGLSQDLSPTRRNGLAAVRARIREIAKVADAPPPHSA